jgi:hypothetical protein
MAVRELSFFGVADLTLMRQADVETGTAHIDGDRIVETRPTGDRDRAERACSRPGQNRPHTLLAGRSRRHQPAVGLHDVDSGGCFQRLHALLKRADVAAHNRHHIRIRDCRTHAFELFELRQYVGR